MRARQHLKGELLTCEALVSARSLAGLILLFLK